MGSRIQRLAMVCLAVGCSSIDAAPPQSAGEPDPPSVHPEELVQREDVERDLVLTLSRRATEPFEMGHDPRLQVVLSNRSKTRSYSVVLSGDGSEEGWREPHVFFAVERRSSASSPWEPAPEPEVVRCGNYDEDWAKDVSSLAPGEEMTLPWFGFHPMWELDQASHARIVAHYVYGDHARDKRKVPPELHPMPPYALASNALEVALDPPLVLEFNWRGTLPKEGEPLSRSFDVVAVNRGVQPLPFATADSGAVVWIELEGEDASGAIHRETLESGISVDDAKDQIAPGSRRNAVGNATAHTEALPRDFRPRRARANLHIWWYTNEGAGESEERMARSSWTAGPL